MTGIANILVILAVVVLVLGRQLRARKIDTERRFWLLPLILCALGLSDKQLIDPAHKAEAIALLAGSLLVVLAMGSVWGWTVRVWRASDGSVWTKGTKATLAAWVGMVAIRIGIFALGSSLHVHQSSKALYLTFGVMLLVRGAVVNWRARGLDARQPFGVVG
ncbi:DUF1453 family protein [Kitasatospora sp. NBC_01287]|uniref:CcdC protein domain-containing protein n=1 Tax=Kitasatospora sp. NBC_01287 TaxID=2903573 RepID=UPI002256D466|nr:CcdC protein domain-containing protein [Kitasatospora sp. NBC_01287]MCX4746470.1 DUF1453 family protein [Kitasatospora sp. NBC_01287]